MSLQVGDVVLRNDDTLPIERMVGIIVHVADNRATIVDSMGNSVTLLDTNINRVTPYTQIIETFTRKGVELVDRV